MGQNSAGGLFHMGEIGLLACADRRGHGDYVDIRLVRLPGGMQVAGLHRRFDQNVQVGLDDVDMPPVDGLHHFG